MKNLSKKMLFASILEILVFAMVIAFILWPRENPCHPTAQELKEKAENDSVIAYAEKHYFWINEQPEQDTTICITLAADEILHDYHIEDVVNGPELVNYRWWIAGSEKNSYQLIVPRGAKDFGKPECCGMVFEYPNGNKIKIIFNRPEEALTDRKIVNLEKINGYFQITRQNGEQERFQIWSSDKS